MPRTHTHGLVPVPVPIPMIRMHTTSLVTTGFLHKSSRTPSFFNSMFIHHYVISVFVIGKQPVINLRLTMADDRYWLTFSEIGMVGFNKL